MFVVFDNALLSTILGGSTSNWSRFVRNYRGCPRSPKITGKKYFFLVAQPLRGGRGGKSLADKKKTCFDARKKI